MSIRPRLGVGDPELTARVARVTALLADGAVGRLRLLGSIRFA